MWSNRALTAALLLVVASASAHGQAALQTATITEHAGAAIPRDLTFTDSTGRPLPLASLVGTRPLVISLAYFTCPMLCQLGQRGEAAALRDSGKRLGRDFSALTLSIDPRDTPAQASEWRARTAALLKADPASMDWHYAVGRERDIRHLADALGFAYAYDTATGQFSHAAALFVITPDGRISRYVYGIEFDPAQIAASIDTAAANETGTPFERFLMRCYCYVPALRRHGGFVVWLLRIGGLVVTTVLVGGIWLLWRRDMAARADEAV